MAHTSGENLSRLDAKRPSAPPPTGFFLRPSTGLATGRRRIRLARPLTTHGLPWYAPAGAAALRCPQRSASASPAGAPHLCPWPHSGPTPPEILTVSRACPAKARPRSVLSQPGLELLQPGSFTARTGSAGTSPGPGAPPAAAALPRLDKWDINGTYVLFLGRQGRAAGDALCCDSYI